MASESSESASEVSESASYQVHTIDPSLDLRKDDQPKQTSASKKLVDNLLAIKAPIAAVITKNVELLQEILSSERFQNFKILKQSKKLKDQETQEKKTEEKKVKEGDKTESQSVEKEDKSEKDGVETEDLVGSSKYPGKEQMDLNQAMLVAVTSKQPEMLEKILEAGGDIHAFDQWYPVLHTITDMRAEELFEVAVKYANDLNVIGHYGNLLHSAVRTGSFSLVKKVYDLGVTEFITCKANGSTVLHEAVRNIPCSVEKKIKENTEGNTEIAAKKNDAQSKDSGENSDDKSSTIEKSEKKVKEKIEGNRVNTEIAADKTYAQSKDSGETSDNKSSTIEKLEKKVKEKIEGNHVNTELAAEKTDAQSKDSGETADDKSSTLEKSKDKTDNKDFACFSDFEAKYDLRAIEFFVEKGCPVDSCDDNNKTPLMEAAILGNKKAVQALIKAGAGKSCRDNSEQTAWLYSALYCHPTLWDDLLDIENLNKQMDQKYLIHKVCELKLDKALEFILKNGADPLVTDGEGKTPMDVAIDSMAVKCICVLLYQPVDILGTKYNGESPFQRILCRFTSFDSVSERNKVLGLFLEKGADIDEQFNNGETPLTDHLESVPETTWLLENGADPNFLLNDGRYPLSAVCNLISLGKVDILKLLLQYNADVTMTCQVVNGSTPLQMAVEKRDFKFAKYCLIAGFSLHMIHDWIRIEQDEVEDLEKSHGFESLIWYIRNTPHEPMSLKGITRIKLLKCIGVTDRKTKILSFGLPKIMEDYLDWEKYIQLREHEFESLFTKFQATKNT